MYPNFYKHTASLTGLAVIATVTIGATASIQESKGPTQTLTVSNNIPAPNFDRMSGVSIIKKPVYAANDRLSPQQLKDLLYSVGFRGQRLKEAWGVAMKESTGRPMAHNQNSKTGDNSHGLFQINMIGSLGPARLEQYKLSSYEDLFDPMTNATIAFQMSDAGKNWSAWNGIGERTKEWMKEFPN
jgi:hypothetical protein